MLRATGGRGQGNTSLHSHKLTIENLRPWVGNPLPRMMILSSRIFGSSRSSRVCRLLLPYFEQQQQQQLQAAYRRRGIGGVVRPPPMVASLPSTLSSSTSADATAEALPRQPWSSARRQQKPCCCCCYRRRHFSSTTTSRRRSTSSSKPAAVTQSTPSFLTTQNGNVSNGGGNSGNGRITTTTTTISSSSYSSVPPTRRGRKGPTLPLEFSESLVPVSAIHVAKTIDLEAAARLFPDALKVRKKNSYIIRLPDDDHHHDQQHHGNLQHGNGEMEDGEENGNKATSNATNPSFLAVYPYGSLVFFNVKNPEQIAAMVHRLKSVTTKPYFDRTESFSVLVSKDNVVEPPFSPTSSSAASAAATAAATTTTVNYSYDRFHIVNGDYCIVPELEWNAVSVIANIMAQTVALDSYADTVDVLLDNFAGINSSVATTGSFRGEKDLLFQTIAHNNSIFIDMISKIRILDRSDTAWNLIQYETIHYGLKEEFEIDDRFENIEFKLNLIEKNAKFFMEVMHSQKSSNLEWCIVVLIAIECILMCVEMSGSGEPLFRAWTSGYLWPPEWLVVDATAADVTADTADVLDLASGTSEQPDQSSLSAVNSKL